MDEQIRQVFSALTHENFDHLTAIILCYIVDQSGGRLLPHYLRCYSLQVISADIPIIRIVFALAAKTPTLTLMHHESDSRTRENYTAYNIWVAGISSDMLGPVIANEQSTWESILQASHDWKEIYSGGDLCTKLCKSMNPGFAVDREF